MTLARDDLSKSEAVLIAAIECNVPDLVTARTLTAVLDWPTEISPVTLLSAFGIAAAVGILFGYYPARRASRLDPIDSLRYE